MKFLIDAQLPKRLADHLSTFFEIDVLHTIDLPKGNTTSDVEILDIAEKENRIVVTKDSDFWDSYILSGRPKKLLIVTTGNISNNDLINIFSQNFDSIMKLFSSNEVIEIDDQELNIHY